MRPRGIKICLLLAGMAAAVVILSACGEGQRPSEEETAEKDVLIYAALNPVSTETQGFVNQFNKDHEDVEIEIHDYSDEGGIDRLLTELVLGQVPDIMEMHYYGKGGATVGTSRREYINPRLGEYKTVVPGNYTAPADEYWMPYRQMAQKGYLEDLWPYIENDPDLGRDGVLQAPLKAAEVNGGLYMLFQRVLIFTLMGRESVVGDRYSWTLEELMDVYADMPEDSTILRYNMTRQEIFFNLLCHSLERYIDWNTGECSFDSQGFRDLVTFLEEIPDRVEYEDPLDATEEVIRRIQNGKQMLEGMLINWPLEFCYSDAIWRERAAFPGYPTSDGSSGSFFYATGEILAMSATCQNKDAAWEYIRKLIRPRRTRSRPIESYMDIPINLHDYELLLYGDLKQAQDVIRTSSNPLTSFPAYYHFGYGPGIPLTHLTTEDDTQRHRDLVDHTTQLYWGEDALANVVWDTLGPYFAGDRDLDATIDLIQRRVSLYVNELR